MEEFIFQELADIKRNTLLAAKNVLTLEDVALLTGLSKQSLYQLTRRGEIPHYCPRGKQLYFDRAEIEAWMKRNRIPSPEAEKGGDA